MCYRKRQALDIYLRHIQPLCASRSFEPHSTGWTWKVYRDSSFHVKLLMARKSLSSSRNLINLQRSLVGNKEKAESGSFSPLPPRFMEEGGFQNDVRMTYCASVVQSVLARKAFESTSAAQYIERCRVSQLSFIANLKARPVGVANRVDMGRSLCLASGGHRSPRQELPSSHHH